MYGLLISGSGFIKQSYNIQYCILKNVERTANVWEKCACTYRKEVKKKDEKKEK